MAKILCTGNQYSPAVATAALLSARARVQQTGIAESDGTGKAAPAKETPGAVRRPQPADPAPADVRLEELAERLRQLEASRE